MRDLLSTFTPTLNVLLSEVAFSLPKACPNNVSLCLITPHLPRRCLRVSPAAARAAPPPPPPPAPSVPVSDGPVDEVRSALREGRAKLKEGNGAAGMVFFLKAKMLSKMKGDMIQLRRAMRGLAACRRLGGDKLGAIEDLELVLTLSKDMDDSTGDADALGAIADMYTELGDLEKAGSYYDRYIKVLTSDSSGKVD